MSAPVGVLDLDALVLHYERGGNRATGGAGGHTRCGLKFVPRVGRWTREKARIRRTMKESTRATQCRACRDDVFATVKA